MSKLPDPNVEILLNATVDLKGKKAEEKDLASVRIS